MRNRTVVLVCLLGAAAVTVVSQQKVLFSVLDSKVLVGRQDDGAFLLVTNQRLRPWGEQTTLRGRPVDLAFDSQKRVLAVLNWRGVDLLDGSTATALASIPSKSTSYTGLSFRPGDRELWASEAARNGPDGLLIASLNELGMPGETAHVKLPGHPVPAGIAFSPDGKKAYVALTNNNTLAVMNAETREVEREVRVGMVPYSVVVAPKRGRIFVTNRAGRKPAEGDVTAFSSSSRVLTDPATGSTASGTVSVIDLKSMEERQVEVGLAPAGLALTPDEKTLAVSNAHSDSVTLMDTASLAAQTVKIPAWPEGSFGSQPSGLVFSPDGKTLYVACGGINAIAVLTPEGGRWKLAGELPAGWFPTALAADRDGSLRVANVKGVGSTLNAAGTHNSREYEGSVSRIPAPGPAQLQAGLREVKAANSPKFTPVGGVDDLSKLGIEHVFLIIKENRTYDQIFGDVTRGNGDPALAIYGGDVTPNHHALAEQFVLLDNFYTGGAISFDGHQWLVQAFVSDYVERAFSSSPRGYAWNLSDALTVAPTGFFWQGAPRPLDVRLYGPFSIPALRDPATGHARDINESRLLDWTQYWQLYKTGKWRDVVASRSGVPALDRFYERRYPPSETHLTDQIRAEAWLEELAEREKSGVMPNLCIFTMTSDHTNGTRPGSPTPRAMVADNDAALGRMVEGISRSRFWPKSLILVTEDDAQDGIDHVDGHRTIALAIGPRIRRNVVDSNNYNHSSLIRTIQHIFGIAPRTRYLATARSMNSIFQTAVDLRPFQAVQPRLALDEMNPPLRALSGKRLWAARQSAAMNWREVDDIPAATLNRILWWDARGYETPMPALPGRSSLRP